MAIDEDAVAVLAAKFAVMRMVAGERTWRVYLGTEARALGHGGIAAVARAAGVSETMVAAGVAEVEAGELEELPPGRSRRAGGGRKKADDAGRITLYGIYDIAANRGFVSVGTSCDTAAFAVNALRLWWQRESLARYPGARRLLVTCDAGSSNGYRCRLWKDQLAVLAAETGLAITVCHFPPGTSKWNKIEHRLFCHITRTWRARPLMTVNDAVAGIAATVTGQGLKCTAVLDDADYPGGVKISDQQMDYLEDRILDRYGTRGEWNYAVLPAPARPRNPDPPRRRTPAPAWPPSPPWPASPPCPPCWTPSPSRSPPPASSGCTWTAATAAARPAAAPRNGSRSRPS